MGQHPQLFDTSLSHSFYGLLINYRNTCLLSTKLVVSISHPVDWFQLLITSTCSIPFTPWNKHWEHFNGHLSIEMLFICIGMIIFGVFSYSNFWIQQQIWRKYGESHKNYIKNLKQKMNCKFHLLILMWQEKKCSFFLRTDVKYSHTNRWPKRTTTATSVSAMDGKTYHSKI